MISTEFSFVFVVGYFEMPFTSRLFVFFGFLFLIAGVVLWGLSHTYGVLFPLSLHFITLGWITNLIFGVAFWMFPKPHRRYKAPFLSLVSLNTGNLLRVSEVFLSSHNHVAGFVFILSVSLQFIACVVFASHIWKRIGMVR